jgi:hypothetical protein
MASRAADISSLTTSSVVCRIISVSISRLQCVCIWLWIRHLYSLSRHTNPTVLNLPMCPLSTGSRTVRLTDVPTEWLTDLLINKVHDTGWFLAYDQTISLEHVFFKRYMDDCVTHFNRSYLWTFWKLNWWHINKIYKHIRVFYTLKCVYTFLGPFVLNTEVHTNNSIVI